MKLQTFSQYFTALAGFLLIAGCATDPGSATVFDVTGFVDCREEALALDESARHGGMPAQYAKAGRLAGRCVDEAGPDYGNHEADAMRLQLLGVLDLLRGGHVSEARDLLHAFESRFPGRDLRDGAQASLVDALELVLSDGVADADANVPPALAAEMTRIGYWRRQ